VSSKSKTHRRKKTNNRLALPKPSTSTSAKVKTCFWAQRDANCVTCRRSLKRLMLTRKNLKTRLLPLTKIFC